jgi:hypothetical protein
MIVPDQSGYAKKDVAKVYNDGGKRAGTYEWSGESWNLK